jgi:hypothetical protein
MVCNFLKDEWDPRAVALSDDPAALFEAARKYVTKQREKHEGKLAETRRLIRGLELPSP